jgi:hypothetical protein
MNRQIPLPPSLSDATKEPHQKIGYGSFLEKIRFSTTVENH